MVAPRYQPLWDELGADEKKLLELLSPLGLDWVTTCGEFAQRLGVTRYFDWRDVVALPPSTALSDAPLTFCMYADPDLMG